MTFLHRLIVAWSCAGLLLACAHGPKTFVDYPAADLSLAPSQSAPEVDALVSAFYERAFDPKQLHAQVEQVLAKHPDASRAHEVAAYLALLDGDSSAALDHFIRAASDIGSQLTALYLWELDQNPRGAREDNRIVQLMHGLIAHHPSAAVRDAARVELGRMLRYRLELDEAAQLAEPMNYLREWNVIGAFDNDQGKGFLTTYPPESAFESNAEYPGKILPVHWRELRTDPSGLASIDDWVAPTDFSLAYLATFVASDSAGAAELRLSVGDAVQVWWNDALVASEETIRAAAADNLVIPVQVQSGWNKLLIKSCVRNRDWWLTARVTKPDGEAWPGLRSSRAPQTYTPQHGAPPAAISFKPSWLAQEPNPGRREFLSSRFAAMAGRSKELLPPLERWLALAPDNALARYQIAMAYWRNEEMGKAIDALNLGVRKSPELFGFQLMRARYYRQKHLWDQALADLAKVASTASATGPVRPRREVYLELGEVFRGRGFTIDRCRSLIALIKSSPDFEGGHVVLANCLEALGYVEQAEAEVEAALALAPGHTQANQHAIELALRRLDYASALEHNAHMRAKEPFALGWAMERANIERRRGDRAASRALYAGVRAQDPDFATVYERLADLAYEDARGGEALADYQRALARNPRSVPLAERVATLDPKARDFVETQKPGEAEIEHAITAASNVQVLPGSYVVRLLDHEVTEIGNDGSAKSIVTRVLRAESQQGVDRMSKIDLPGASMRRVLRAYSQSPSGERQEASSIDEHSVRFRKLEPGSMTVLQFVYYQPPGAFLPNHFASHRFFQSPRDQIESATWIVVHGPGRSLDVAIQGAVKRTDTQVGERTLHTFSAEHVPPLIEEPFQPPAADVFAQVSVSTLHTWDEYVRWERALLTEAFRRSPEIEALAKRLTESGATPKAKLDQLLRFVANEIRYQQEYETTIAGVRPHPGSITLERGYGDCKDKSVLLIALARTIDLHLQLALLRTTGQGRVQPDLPNQQFNHAIVYVPKEAGFGDGFFLDPTAEELDIGNLRADDQGALALVIDPERASGHRFIPIPYDAPELEYENHDIAIAIASPTQASAVDKISARGNGASRIRVLLRNREVADKTLQHVASMMFTGATLERRSSEHAEDVWHPLQMQLDLDVSNAIQSQSENTWRLPVPVFLPDTAASSLTSRRMPIRFGPYASLGFRLSATLPADLRLVQAPAAFDVEHTCLQARRRSEVKGQQVTITLDYTRRCAEVSVEDYAAFRRAALDIQRQLRDEIVFARAGVRTTK